MSEKKKRAFPSKFSICPWGMPFEEKPQAMSSNGRLSRLWEWEGVLKDIYASA